MAKATKVIHKMEVDPEVKHKQELHELEQLLLEHKDVLQDTLAIADKMRDHEIFDIINSGLGQSDKVINRVVTAFDDSEVPQSIKNMLLLFQLLGTVDMSQIEPIVLKLNTGIAKAAEYEHEDKPGGYSGLLGALKDPEVIEGVNVLVKILKGMGTHKDDEENVEPQKERIENPKMEMNEKQSEDSAPVQRRPSKRYALAAGAGAAAFLLPLVFMKK
ncbi:DUF1641 domain-containing protein [Salinicoccus sp. HZC-1]|uniref:DUF1641 domain-containing protein n=1 Tax=Salinicoccus sp. HZC-1 TaxID=3385497 RepID=UPI00398B58A3